MSKAGSLTGFRRPKFLVVQHLRDMAGMTKPTVVTKDRIDCNSASKSRVQYRPTVWMSFCPLPCLSGSTARYTPKDCSALFQSTGRTLTCCNSLPTILRFLLRYQTRDGGNTCLAGLVRTAESRKN